MNISSLNIPNIRTRKVDSGLGQIEMVEAVMRHEAERDQLTIENGQWKIFERLERGRLRVGCGSALIPAILLDTFVVSVRIYLTWRGLPRRDL